MERLSEGRGRREKCTTGAQPPLPRSGRRRRRDRDQGGGAGAGRGQSLGAGPGRLLRALYGVSRAWAGAGSLDGQEPRVARFLARWGLWADGAKRCSGSGPSLRGWHGICGGMYSFAD